VSLLTTARSMKNRAPRSSAVKANVAGLLVAAAGMLLQIAAGSTLYPTLAGPLVLTVAALIVAVLPAPWAKYVGLLVPLLLGVGAAVAAVMTGGLIEQLTDVTRFGVLLGTVMHVVGLSAAVAGGARMVAEERTGRQDGR
jgi:hypothetical protein